jgi:hypothetical protein
MLRAGERGWKRRRVLLLMRRAGFSDIGGAIRNNRV